MHYPSAPPQVQHSSQRNKLHAVRELRLLLYKLMRPTYPLTAVLAERHVKCGQMNNASELGRRA